MLSLHSRSFLRMIRRDWEIYLLQFATLSIAFATLILVVSFTAHEFTAGNEFNENVVRVLLRHETSDYEGRNRLTDRIPVNVYETLQHNRNFSSVSRVKSLTDQQTHAVDPAFRKYFHEQPRDFQALVDFHEDSIQALSYDPFDFAVFAELAPGVSAEAATAAINIESKDNTVSYQIQPAGKMYFGPRVVGESIKHGDFYCVFILVCISFLIIVVAVTNFVNLTTLTLPARAKEIAMRKVAGAGRPPLFGLMVKESGFIVLVSLFTGCALLIGSASWMREHLSINIIEWLANNTIATWALLGILIAAIVAAPLLPSWAFIKASPGRLLGTDAITFPQMKRVITVLQLGVSISLIVVSLVINRQISRSLIKEPGKNHEQIVYVSFPEELSIAYFNRMKTEWPRDYPNVVDITAVSHTPDHLTSRPVGKDYYRLNVDYSFKDFFRLNMASGLWFGPNDGERIIINEASVARQTQANEPLGVLQNFAGVYNLPDKPVHITHQNDEYNFVLIRILEVDIRKTIGLLERTFSEMSNGRKVNVYFMDQSYAATLAYEDRLNRLSNLLSLISVVMAICAIYALSLSRMKDNLKQIAIRKTFGASNLHIVRKLSGQFLELMLGSVFFFGPLTYWLLREWLRNFAYAARFDWSDPLISIGACLVIVGITNLLLLGRLKSSALRELLRR